MELNGLPTGEGQLKEGAVEEALISELTEIDFSSKEGKLAFGAVCYIWNTIHTDKTPNEIIALCLASYKLSQTKK